MSTVFKEYADYDALGLAELIASKAISPQEVLDAALHRIEHLNPLVNAVSISMSDIARVFPRKPARACLRTACPKASVTP